MKVYVITRGDYSDYHICGVAVDKKKAQLIKKLNSDDMYLANIEEYDTDEYYDDEMPQWVVKFSNNRQPIVDLSWFDNNMMHKPPKIFDYSDRYVDDELPFIGIKYLVRLQAKDKERALKIAQDELARYKAEKEGIT